jgi:hypothetical protein
MEPNSQIEGMVQESSWLVYCDGPCGSVRARAAAILISPSRIKLCNTAKLQFTNEADKCTNNITEYEAILLGLCKFRVIGVQTCVLRIELKVVSSPDREGMYSKRDNTGEILSPCPKDGKSLQRLHCRVH